MERTGRINLRQLQYFVHVAELKSFTRAALSARVAQPALSRQVRNLEEDIGISLFHRDGRGAILTEPGQLYYERVKAILRDFDEARAEAQAARETPSGEVALGVPPQLGPGVIVDIVRRFRARCPDARIRVSEGFSYQIADWLRTGRLDIGLVYDPDSYRHISAQILVEESLYLLGPPGSRWTARSTVPFRDIAGLPLVMPDLPSTLRNRIDEIAASLGVSMTIEIAVDSLPAIRQLVRDGVGHTIMPYAAAPDELRSGLMSAARIVEPAFSRPLAVALPQTGTLSLATRRLIDLIEEEVRSLIAGGAWSAQIVERADAASAGLIQVAE